MAMDSHLIDAERKHAFLMLIGLQDCGLSVASARCHVAKHYGVSSAEVVAVEREGLRESWPPFEK